MTRAGTVDLLRASRAGGYAVAAVNVLDDLSMRAVIAAAQAQRSPIIIQTSVKTVRSLGGPQIADAFGHAAASTEVPVALHLDHCADRSVITECIADGWSSVLFDASDRSLAQAQLEMATVVAQAHEAGVSVEAEIENIAGVEDGVGSDLEGAEYPVDTIADFVAATGCDFFAPAVGTAHGLYSTRPVLAPQRAQQLADRLDLPLVLHGGTGLSEEEFTEFIKAGCAKINLSTTVKRTYMKSALAHLRTAEERDKWDPPSLFADIHAAVQADVEQHLVTFGSAGRA